jgi:tetratricopeptide (TPR) repeat protein
LIRALLAFGSLLREQRKYDEAWPLFNRAAQLSAATRRHRLAAETQHDLFTLAVLNGTYAESEHHMLKALQHYPIHHPAVPALVHDWSFLLVRLGHYHEALRLLNAALPQFKRPGMQMLAWGMIGRVAAATGDRLRFDTAVATVRTLSRRTDEFTAAAHGNLAQGARFWGEWDLGRALATQAIDVSRARREWEVEHEVREFLAGIESEKAPSVHERPPASNKIETISGQVLSLLVARERPQRRPVQPSEWDTMG